MNHIPAFLIFLCDMNGYINFFFQYLQLGVSAQPCLKMNMRFRGTDVRNHNYAICAELRVEVFPPYSYFS
jgi:hypothetical protein